MSRIPLWIDLRGVPLNRRLPYLSAIREAGAERVLLGKGDAHLQKEGLPAVAVDGHRALRDGRRTIGRIITVSDARSQAKAAAAAGIVVVEAPDWRIIPLENLIAARRSAPGTLFAHAATPGQAALFADTLETGVHGIVLAPGSPGDILSADRLLRERFGRVATAPPAQAAATQARAPETPPGPAALELVPATVTRIEDAGPGDRVCIDTTSLFAPGEGLLVGSTARSFALLHAETAASDLVPSRPFRVNAGAVHCYTLGPDGRTAYLSELAAGSRVLAVSAQGGSRPLTVGRAKIERRPHLIVHWDAPGGAASVAVQNAETIRLVAPDGTPLNVTALKPGDTILVHHESSARHTGLPVDASMQER
jgi:3-dehydroquinate synthase II